VAAVQNFANASAFKKEGGCDLRGKDSKNHINALPKESFQQTGAGVTSARRDVERTETGRRSARSFISICEHDKQKTKKSERQWSFISIVGRSMLSCEASMTSRKRKFRASIHEA
jgi:hypothetical protein